MPEFSVELPSGSTVGPAHLDIGPIRADTGYVPAWDTERAVAESIAWIRSEP